MQKVELVPDLNHCIETAARKEYASVLSQLLECRKRNKLLEEKLEILRLFLETSDFRRLRAESENKIMQGKKVKFIVYIDNGLKYDFRVI